MKLSCNALQERRAFFAQASCYETNTVLTVTFKPSYSLTVGLLGDKQTFEKILKDFNSAVDNFENQLSSVLELARLEEYEDEDEFGQTHLYSTFLSHIQQCLTGDFHPMRVPEPCGMFLDGVLGGQDLVTGFEPRLGDKHLLTLSIDGFPLASFPSILETLSGLPLSYRFNSRYIGLDQQDAIKATEDYRKGWAQQIFGFMDKYFKNPNARPNRDAALMTEDAEALDAHIGELLNTPEGQMQALQSGNSLAALQIKELRDLRTLMATNIQGAIKDQEKEAKKAEADKALMDEIFGVGKGKKAQ